MKSLLMFLIDRHQVSSWLIKSLASLFLGSS